jgi:hypothetical protein
MWARLSVNPSAAIFGTFVAMAVIAAAARRCLRDHSCRDGCNAAGLGSHTCTPRSSPNDFHNRYGLPIVLTTMAQQRPILEALALSVLLLLLAALGLLDPGLRFTLRC